MMTRTDYIQIAAILTETRTWARDRANTQPTIDHIVRELADLMAAGNPNFDRKRFYAATGMEPRNFPGFPSGTFKGQS